MSLWDTSGHLLLLLQDDKGQFVLLPHVVLLLFPLLCRTDLPFFPVGHPSVGSRIPRFPRGASQLPFQVKLLYLSMTLSL